MPQNGLTLASVSSSCAGVVSGIVLVAIGSDRWRTVRAEAALSC